MASVAEQLYISGSSQGYGREDDAGLVRIFLPENPNGVQMSANRAPPQTNLTPDSTPLEISKIGMIGLGAMGQGIASSLLRAGYSVHGYDVVERAIDKFLTNTGKAAKASSPVEAIVGAELVVIMVQNAAQVDDLLFGSGKGAESLLPGAIVILNSTVPPSYVKSLAKRLEGLEKGISLIDAPVSGGVARAANGTLTVSDHRNVWILSYSN